MNECVDGDYQTFKSRDGKYVRDEFFGRYPETAALVGRHERRRRSGASSAAATTRSRSTRRIKPPSNTRGQPTVVLAKTIKGYGMGEAGEAHNIAHQAKKMERRGDARVPRPLLRCRSPTSRSETRFRSTSRPTTRPEMRYLRERVATRGQLPQRRRTSAVARRAGTLRVRRRSSRARASAKISTTMAFVRDSQHDRRAITRSARASCRSSPTSRARSAWRACSASSASTRRSASSTIRKTPSS